MIKAILFDFDDTLVKTKEIRYQALKETGNKFYGQNISDKRINKYWGKPFNQFISGVFNNVETVEILTKKYKSIVIKYPNKPFPNTISVLNKLAKKHFLGVISSSNPDLIKSGMKDVGIDKNMFLIIQSSEDTQIHKPDPHVFVPSLKKLSSKNVNRTEIVYVGDAVDDYVAANKACLYFCGIANRTVGESEFIKNNIPYIDNIKQLPNYIDRLKKNLKQERGT